MGKRCQVCDGPIVNGRCKYCGMPYRNDMELYHLNEDRSEHYRHASAKVKKAMAENEIPLSDRNKTVPKAAKTSQNHLLSLLRIWLQVKLYRWTRAKFLHLLQGKVLPIPIQQSLQEL